MSENELEQEIRALLRRYGLYGYHTHDSRRSPAGWPDWVILGRGLLFRELKSTGGYLTPAQRRVGYMLKAAGQDWDVWRPADLESGRIQRELERIS